MWFACDIVRGTVIRFGGGFRQWWVVIYVRSVAEAGKEIQGRVGVVEENIVVGICWSK